MGDAIATMREIVWRADGMSHHFSDTDFLLSFTGGESLKDAWQLFDMTKRRHIIQWLLDSNLSERVKLVDAVRLHRLTSGSLSLDSFSKNSSCASVVDAHESDGQELEAGALVSKSSHSETIVDIDAY